MPRYLFETKSVDTSDVEAAIVLAARRYPEISVEHRYTARGGTSARDLWVCRAPSDTHLERWAAAAQLPVASVQQVEAETTPSQETRRSSRPVGGQRTMITTTTETGLTAPDLVTPEHQRLMWLAIVVVGALAAIGAVKGGYEGIDVLDGPGARAAATVTVDSPAAPYGSADSLERQAEPAPVYGSADSLERAGTTERVDVGSADAAERWSD